MRPWATSCDELLARGPRCRSSTTRRSCARSDKRSVDELRDVASETTTLVELSSGHRGLGRAVGALGSDDPSERALAHEALEVTAGPTWGPVVMSLLGAEPGDVAATPAAGWLGDLVNDSDGVWQEPWLRVCALYAAPLLQGDRARGLAEPWVDDPDPAVSETARWVLARDRD